MLTHFIKYQSLGNDFILFDWYQESLARIDAIIQPSQWAETVRLLCNRHTGIGADGVLILKNNLHVNQPEMIIYNADGSHALMCMNGLRCVAHYLFTTYAPHQEWSIRIGTQQAQCSATYHNNTILITTNIANNTYYGTTTIQVDHKSLEGHIVSVGNPHFIIYQETTLSWLEKYGSIIEHHKKFPEKTNVEFLWNITESNMPHQHYYILVHERGCGITQACSSGVAASLVALINTHHIKPNELVTISMPGGSVTGCVNCKNNVILTAQAHLVFKGDIP